MAVKGHRHCYPTRATAQSVNCSARPEPHYSCAEDPKPAHPRRKAPHRGHGLYRSDTAETLLEAGERFDVVLGMEVIEHVTDHQLFLQTCVSLTGPKGLVILSTINRTLKSWFQAIVMGEHILGLLPRGAHQWDRFVTPEEIRAELARNGMRTIDVSGVTMNLRTRAMQLSSRTGVNYILTAHR